MMTDGNIIFCIIMMKANVQNFILFTNIKKTAKYFFTRKILKHFLFNFYIYSNFHLATNI